jgi:ferredoxin
VADSLDAKVIENATTALAKGTEAFAAERMNHSIQKALAGRNVESHLRKPLMPVIRILPHPGVLPRTGAEVTAPAGTSICEALLDNHINIEHACDMSCACTTCHVIVREGINSP